MRIRLRPLHFLAFCTFAFVLNTFSGLAGPLSSLISVLLPSVFFCSVLQLALSWFFFAFHQSFSNDHPLKGEVVRFELHTSNESAIPFARGMCRISAPDPREIALDLKPYQAEIRCAYRGAYSIGLVEYGFTDALGLVHLEEQIEPRIFYVYPELAKLDSGLDKLASASGTDQPKVDAREEDLSIFEYIRNLRDGRPARRIAWKHWAATGIPSEIVHGQSRSSALRIVLDLFPLPSEETERLAAEDIAVSAAFSALQYLTSAGIPAEFVLGSAERGSLLSSPEDFRQAFDHSTNIIFVDRRFPAAAFLPGPATLLISTRPLIEAGEKADLFSECEKAIKRGTGVHLLVCPPPSEADAERRALETLRERQAAFGGNALLELADSRHGLEEIIHAFRS